MGSPAAELCDPRTGRAVDNPRVSVSLPATRVRAPGCHRQRDCPHTTQFLCRPCTGEGAGHSVSPPPPNRPHAGSAGLPTAMRLWERGLARGPASTSYTHTEVHSTVPGTSVLTKRRHVWTEARNPGPGGRALGGGRGACGGPGRRNTRTTPALLDSEAASTDLLLFINTSKHALTLDSSWTPTRTSS